MEIRITVNDEDYVSRAKYDAALAELQQERNLHTRTVSRMSELTQENCELSIKARQYGERIKKDTARISQLENAMLRLIVAHRRADGRHLGDPQGD